MSKRRPIRRRAAAPQAPPIPSPPPKESAALIALWAAALAIFLAGIFAREISDTDFWWHLATGRYMAQTGSLPVPDPFSYTSNLGGEAYPGESDVRSFNLTHEWLAQLAWYGLFKLGGFPLLVIWKALLMTFFLGSGAWPAWKATGSPLAASFAGLAGTPLAVVFASDRPALLSFALVAGYILLFERYRETGNSRLLWCIPALQWVWANSHGGFFLGWAVIGAYAVESLRETPARQRALWTTLGLSIAAAAFNPNGLGIFGILLAYRESFLTSTLIEWQRPPLWGPPYTFQALLYLAFAVAAVSWHRLRPAHGLLLAAFGAASMMALRNLAFIAFLAPMVVAVYGWPWLEPRLKGFSRSAQAAVCIAIVAGLFVWRPLGGMFQLRAAEWKLPSEAARFILESDIYGQMFNSYELGGYLIWAAGPERQVFIDGRALNESVYKDYRQILYGTAGERERLLEEYGVEYIFTNSFEFLSGTLYPLVPALADPANTQWELVFQDSKAVVFVRAREENREIIAQRRLPKASVFEHLDASCAVFVAHRPDAPHCARTLGMFYLSIGEAERARAALELYRNRWPYQDAEADAALRSLR